MVVAKLIFALFISILMFCGHLLISYRLLLVGLLEICKESAPFFGFVSMFPFNFQESHIMTHYIILSKINFVVLILFVFVQIRLRDYGVLDFDAGDARRQPPVDTTWQQVLNTYNFILQSSLHFVNQSTCFHL
jgi:hypothetical protein